MSLHANSAKNTTSSEFDAYNNHLRNESGFRVQNAFVFTDILAKHVLEFNFIAMLS